MTGISLTNSMQININ